MDGLDLLRRVPRDLFEPPADIGFRISRWQSEAPEGAEFLLPSDLRAGNGLLFYGP